jgi:cytochrome b
VRAYLGDMLHNREARYLGHNPAGAVMVLAILVTMSGTAYTGWLMEDAARLATGPALSPIVAPAHADDDGDAGEAAAGRVAAKACSRISMRRSQI